MTASIPSITRPAGGAGAPAAVAPLGGYAHHGIHVADNRLVHYEGSSRSLLRRPVEEVSLAQFAAGRKVANKRDGRAIFSPAEIGSRSRLGENRYRITTNSCEHFCQGCRSGHRRGEQIERIAGWVPATALTVTRMLNEIFGAGLKPDTNKC